MGAIQATRYCPECGTKLEMRFLQGEGEVPYCRGCGDYRFPVFSVAVSMICLSRAHDRALLIRQYGRDAYILVAGYVGRGEDAEDACAREMREEMGLEVEEVRFNRSHYFAPSNTLMLNFTVTVDETQAPVTNGEVDSWAWFPLEEARAAIKPNSLAKAFLEGYITGRYAF